jgi:hypothetical protein
MMMMMRVSIAHDEKVTNNNTGKEEDGKKKRFSSPMKENVFFSFSVQLRAVVVYTHRYYTHHYDEFSPPSKQLQKNTHTHTHKEYRNNNLSLYIAHIHPVSLLLSFLSLR